MCLCHHCLSLKWQMFLNRHPPPKKKYIHLCVSGYFLEGSDNQIQGNLFEGRKNVSNPLVTLRFESSWFVW